MNRPRSTENLLHLHSHAAISSRSPSGSTINGESSASPFTPDVQDWRQVGPAPAQRRIFCISIHTPSTQVNHGSRASPINGESSASPFTHRYRVLPPFRSTENLLHLHSHPWLRSFCDRSRIRSAENLLHLHSHGMEKCPATRAEERSTENLLHLHSHAGCSAQQSPARARSTENLLHLHSHNSGSVRRPLRRRAINGESSASPFTLDRERQRAHDVGPINGESSASPFTLRRDVSERPRQQTRSTENLLHLHSHSDSRACLAIALPINGESSASPFTREAHGRGDVPLLIDQRRIFCISIHTRISFRSRACVRSTINGESSASPFTHPPAPGGGT